MHGKQQTRLIVRRPTHQRASISGESSFREYNKRNNCIHLSISHDQQDRDDHEERPDVSGAIWMNIVLNKSVSAALYCSLSGALLKDWPPAG